ncbi:MAG: hypothetical protein ACOX0R_01000 [Candidatus Dojkabacteria bacterium]|jgi:hypothetical protein
MEMFKHVINNWSIYQIVALSIMFLLILAVILLAVWYLTRSKKFIGLTTTSFLLSALLTLLAFLVANLLLKIVISYIYLLTPIIVLTVNLIHIGMSVGFYNAHRMQKNPDMQALRKEFLKDSLQISIFIVLLFASFLIFLSGEAFTFLLLTGIVTIVMTWVNFGLVKLFFRND